MSLGNVSTLNSLKKKVQRVPCKHRAFICLEIYVYVLQIYYQMFTDPPSPLPLLFVSTLSFLNYFSADLSTPFHLQSPPFLFSHPSSFPMRPPAMAPCHPLLSVLLHLFVFFHPPPLPYFSSFLLCLTCPVPLLLIPPSSFPVLVMSLAKILPILPHFVPSSSLSPSIHSIQFRHMRYKNDNAVDRP